MCMLSDPFPPPRFNSNHRLIARLAPALRRHLKHPQDTFGNTDITNGRCYHQDRNYQEDNNGEKARCRCKGASRSSNMD